MRYLALFLATVFSVGNANAREIPFQGDPIPEQVLKVFDPPLFEGAYPFVALLPGEGATRNSLTPDHYRTIENRANTLCIRLGYVGAVGAMLDSPPNWEEANYAVYLGGYVFVEKLRSSIAADVIFFKQLTCYYWE